MPRVIELFRYPVKSFTPEKTNVLRVVDGRVAGDRVFAFRFANKGSIDDLVWQAKHNFVAMVNTPGLGLIKVEFDELHRALSFKFGEEVFVNGSIDSHSDRVRICQAVYEFISGLDVNPFSDHPERLPLNLIGDGRRGLFHDTAAGGLTLHSVDSVRAVETGMSLDIDGRRFRSNVIVEGTAAWEEFTWPSRLVIGEHKYNIVRPVTRCLAVHANPVTGERDIQLMDGLVRANGVEAPTFGIRLDPVDSESEICVGDSVRPIF